MATKPNRGLDENAVLRSLVEGTATHTGSGFFEALVKNLAEALNTYGAWVTEYIESQRRLRALAFWLGGGWVPEWEMAIDGTPCEKVIDTLDLVHYPDNVLALYPTDSDLHTVRAASYMGVPLLGTDGKVLGHLAVLDRHPMPAEPRLVALFKIFAARGAAELQRLHAEKEVRESEEKLSRVVESALDSIVELDEEFRISLINSAGQKLFADSKEQLLGRDLRSLLTGSGGKRLTDTVAEFDANDVTTQYVWIPGGLELSRTSGGTVQTEATLSRYRTNGRHYHALILRNVNERIEAERRIQSLTGEREYLREEMRRIQRHGDIIGDSEPMQRVLLEIAQVAETDATVLIQGETGTGKELIARAIHNASGRRERALIRVNCAAIPAALMESEFFGHEKGAFTGALMKREGRFSLADGGTIFLDEIGELSLDLQAKLLRVLQEGEFEPVGSSKTRNVDVRVIAATNRDLKARIATGTFRDDLFYRLNVFPVLVPPLRNRGNDIVTLASTFADRYSRELGRVVEPLTTNDKLRLERYAWPGNVRELQNVIERAVITSENGRLNLQRAVPDSEESPGNPQPTQPPDNTEVITEEALRTIERTNILRALRRAEWKISGNNGAASLIGVKPSTLTSRMKSLGIERPR